MQFKAKPESDVIDAIQIKFPVIFMTSDKTYEISKNDWIATDAAGNIRVYTDESMTNLFTPLNHKVV
jgi:hypothetical protein